MSVDTNTSVGGRVISAFFDTPQHADRAIDDLVAAGIPRQHVSRVASEAADAPADHRTFWDSLRDVFLPDQDRHAYAEGLRRGGFLVTVHTEEGNYTRVLHILDTDGAVDMDEREKTWKAEGWDHHPRTDITPASSAMPTATASDNATLAGTAYGASTTTASSVDTNWRTDGAARAAALDGAVPASARAAQATRDATLERTRVRGYHLGGADLAERTPQTGTFSPQADASRIVEHMTVFSADGQNIGTVDHLEGPDRIRLTRTSSPDGQHHLVPFTWIDHVDQHVHLHKTLAEIKAQRAEGTATA